MSPPLGYGSCSFQLPSTIVLPFGLQNYSQRINHLRFQDSRLVAVRKTHCEEFAGHLRSGTTIRPLPAT